MRKKLATINRNGSRGGYELSYFHYFSPAGAIARGRAKHFGLLEIIYPSFSLHQLPKEKGKISINLPKDLNQEKCLWGVHYVMRKFGTFWHHFVGVFTVETILTWFMIEILMEKYTSLSPILDSSCDLNRHPNDPFLQQFRPAFEWRYRLSALTPLTRTQSASNGPPLCSSVEPSSLHMGCIHLLGVQ